MTFQKLFQTKQIIENNLFGYIRAKDTFFGKLYNRKNELEQESVNEEIYDKDLSVGKEVWLNAIQSGFSK